MAIKITTFASRLKEGLALKNIRAVDLSNITGISKQKLSQYTNGVYEAKQEGVYLLAKALDVSEAWLMGYDVPSDRSGLNPAAITEKGVRISVLGKVSAGVPIEAIEEEVDWEEIPADWIRGGKEFFGLKVQGDSMYPKYLEGDTVIVRKDSTCESGQDCVVYVNGYDATIKTVKWQEDGSISLIPFNREYPAKTYTKEEIASTPVSIYGVVVELRRKLK